ncbi:MAG: hypothetical protein WD572_08620 [Gammaproteobacteria bacterium]
MSRFHFLILLGLWLAGGPARAEWQMVDGDNGTSARIINANGHELKIYRDASDAIYARLQLADGLYSLRPDACPTYQVDQREPRNTSINTTGCIIEPNSVEFILGYIEAGRVVSLPLHEFMNGSEIHYRFALASGGYQATKFSLSGSLRTLRTVLGQDLEILPR